MVQVLPSPEVPATPAVRTLSSHVCCVRGAALTHCQVEEEQGSGGLPSQLVSLCAFLWRLLESAKSIVPLRLAQAAVAEMVKTCMAMLVKD